MENTEHLVNESIEEQHNHESQKLVEKENEQTEEPQNENESETQVETDNSMSDSIVNIQDENKTQEENQNYDACLTDSMVNIPSLPPNTESTFNNQDENKTQEENQNDDGCLTESMVNIPSLQSNTDEPPVSTSPPPPSDMTEIMQTDAQITESIIEIKHQNDEDKISITQSTLVLTHSQILNDNLQPCAELESINTIECEQKETNINTESMIVTNLSSEASSFVNSPVNSERADFDEQQKQEETQATEEAKKIYLDKLEKEYEIPNFADNNLKNEIESLTQEITSKLKEVQASAEEDLKEGLEKEPEKRVEDRKYVKILGNDALQKKILEYGDDIVGRPVNGQMVTISYDAYLKDNRDKLVDHSENYSFILGDGDVTAALDMIVSLMDKNEKCEAICESRLAFGDLGKQPDIPPKSDLVYTIHLIDFKDLTDLNEMGPVERLSLAEAKKMRGNFHFNRQDYDLAIQSYKKGIRYFSEGSLKGDEKEEDLDKFLELSQALLMNTALSFYKSDNLRQALETLEEVLNAQTNHVKALYIRGKILLQMGETEEAVKSLSNAVQLDPANMDIKKELTKAQAKHKIQYENEKKMYQKMISGASKKEESKKSKAAKKADSNYSSLIAAGLAVAVASVGVAIYARYKNMF